MQTNVRRRRIAAGVTRWLALCLAISAALAMSLTGSAQGEARARDLTIGPVPGTSQPDVELWNGMWPTLSELVNAGVIDEQQAQDTLDATNAVENLSSSCPEFYFGSVGTHATIVRCSLDVNLQDDLDISLPALVGGGVPIDDQATTIYAAFDSIVHCTTRVTT